MWIIKRTGEIYANRKEIKRHIGQYTFKKMLKSGDVYFITPEMIDKIQKTMMLKNGTLSIQ